MDVTIGVHFPVVEMGTELESVTVGGVSVLTMPLGPTFSSTHASPFLTYRSGWKINCLLHCSFVYFACSGLCGNHGFNFPETQVKAGLTWH